MTPLTFIVLAIAGGLGAVTRFLLDGTITSWLGSRLPWSTIVINLSGSLLLGLLTGAVSSHLLPAVLQFTVGVGFLGGYTTFSTASFDTIALLRQGRVTLSLVNGLGVLIACTALACAGLWLGSALG